MAIKEKKPAASSTAKRKVATKKVAPKQNFKTALKKEITRTIRTKKVVNKAVAENIRLFGVGLVFSYVLVLLISFSPNTIEAFMTPVLLPTPAPALISLPIDEDIDMIPYKTNTQFRYYNQRE
jgi:hypothetical protein